MRGKIQAFTRLLAFSGMLLLLPMMLLSSIDVVLRKFCSITVPGTAEISSLLLALFVLLGLSYTHQRRGHVRISFFVKRLPAALQPVTELLTGLLVAIILLLLVAGGWQVVLAERAVTDMLRLPLAPFRMVLVVGCLSFFLEVLIDIVDSIAKMRQER